MIQKIKNKNQVVKFKSVNAVYFKNTVLIIIQHIPSF